MCNGVYVERLCVCCRSTYEEKLSKLERTLDNAVAAAITPCNINTDSILSVPDQLFTDSLPYRAHSDVCADHTLAELYSRGPTPITSDRIGRVTGSDRLDSLTATAGVREDRSASVVTDIGSRYSYVPLHRAAISTTHSIDNSVTPVASNYTHETDTSDIIRELGLDNTETSPPRWYNPPPEKLDPSPDRQSLITGSKGDSKFLPLRTMSSKR